MRNSRMWAFWRRVQYGTGYLAFLGLIFSGVYLMYFYTPASCFDLAQNGDEIGMDCGGKCTRICAFTVAPPRVLWSKSFEIQKGQYNAVAYIENKNILAGTPSISYTFRLYDGAGLITERMGTTVLPPNSTYPVFEGRIDTEGRVPTETTLEIQPADMWLPSTYGRDQFKTVDLKLVEADARPKLNVKIENTDLREAQAVEVVATIFDASGIPLTSSQTFIDTFAGRSQKDIVFTWPNPIAKTVRSCAVPTDIVIAIDLSGSMNNDGGTPAQPITSVLEAASTFASQLRAEDRVSVVTFASKATLAAQLTGNIQSVASSIKKLKIAPAEETGTTNTGDGLEVALGELNSARHNPDARSVVVLLTDGLATGPGEKPEDYAKEKAELLKNDGIALFTIGLGKGVNMNFLQTISSGSGFAYAAPTTNTLGGIYKTITDSICEDGAARIDVIPKVTKAFAPLQ
ncbi:MAG: vWA domain-containing protein [Patescibacteria group bacterium]